MYIRYSIHASPNPCHYHLGAIYRPPNNDETYLRNVTETISKMCLTYPTYNILITGDFNPP